jgi:prolipoprotein diacylglyceryl transferase
LAIFKIWEGGLGILGGLVGGILGVYVFCKICKIRFSNLLYIAVPVIPLAQACGRLGNWFNGELYGTKTNLPWGLDISRGKYQATVFYHPTFLYEIIWDLLIFVILILIFSVHNFTRIKAYLSLPVYLALYTFGRFWIEQIRTDTSEYWLGLRLNSWFILAIFVVSVSGIMFIWLKKSILVKKK